jgi:hypothetical protein
MRLRRLVAQTAQLLDDGSCVGPHLLASVLSLDIIA